MNTFLLMAQVLVLRGQAGQFISELFVSRLKLFHPPKNFSGETVDHRRDVERERESHTHTHTQDRQKRVIMFKLKLPSDKLKEYLIVCKYNVRSKKGTASTTHSWMHTNANVYLFHNH